MEKRKGPTPEPSGALPESPMEGVRRIYWRLKGVATNQEKYNCGALWKSCLNLVVRGWCMHLSRVCVCVHVV